MRTSVRHSLVNRCRGASRVVAALLGLLLLVSAPAPAVASAQAAPLPQPVGYVNDFAGVLSPEASARIGALAEQVHAATRGDMVVVTLPDLGGRPVQEVALRLGREWRVGADARIGDAARNAGVIILLVPKERSSTGRGSCRIETGQGAEGFLTDASAGALCREAIPLLQAGQYSAALVQLSEAVASRYAAAFGVTLGGEPVRRRPRPTPDTQIPWALILFVLFIVVTSMSRRRRGCVGCVPIPIPGPTVGSGWSHGSGWSGGGFGGSGGGFGGGGFGGFGGGGGFSGGGGGADW